jgi:hypothetical protein
VAERLSGGGVAGGSVDSVVFCAGPEVVRERFFSFLVAQAW